MQGCVWLEVCGLHQPALDPNLILSLISPALSHLIFNLSLTRAHIGPWEILRIGCSLLVQKALEPQTQKLEKQISVQKYHLETRLLF